MLSSISKPRRTSRLLCAAVAASLDLSFGGNARATTQPVITDCEVVPVDLYSDTHLYAHFYIEWSGTGQSGNTMYFYRGLNSTNPISTIAVTDMGNINSTGWHNCGVVVDEGLLDQFTAHTQNGATTSDWFYWNDGDRTTLSNGFGKADVYDHDQEYWIGVQAYDGTNWSYGSWAQAADNT